MDGISVDLIIPEGLMPGLGKLASTTIIAKSARSMRRAPFERPLPLFHQHCLESPHYP